MRVVKVTYSDEMPKEQHEKLKNLFCWIFVKRSNLPTDLQAQLIRLMNDSRGGGE